MAASAACISGGETLESFNPYTGAPWALIPRGTKADVDRAVSSAKRAFYGDWRKMSASARGAVLRKLADYSRAVREEGGNH